MRNPHTLQDFQFDMDDEDEGCEDVFLHSLRKAFTNVGRIYNDVCLRLISVALCALPSPLSQAVCGVWLLRAC
jgi:hypothetical protein